jgi:hypothetical protein
MQGVEPNAPDPRWPRHTRRAFPPYRFVPGRNPHPRRDPKGWAYGLPEIPPPRHEPSAWRANEEYLYGIDLYNFAYWWECHESLEGLWHLTGHEGPEALFLQGLIQSAAAHLQKHMGGERGARRLAEEAVDKLGRVGADRFMGVTLPPLAAAIEAYHLKGESGVPPLIRLD